MSNKSKGVRRSAAAHTAACLRFYLFYFYGSASQIHYFLCGFIFFSAKNQPFSFTFHLLASHHQTRRGADTSALSSRVRVVDERLASTTQKMSLCNSLLASGARGMHRLASTIGRRGHHEHGAAKLSSRVRCSAALRAPTALCRPPRCAHHAVTRSSSSSSLSVAAAGAAGGGGGKDAPDRSAQRCVARCPFRWTKKKKKTDKKDNLNEPYL